MTQRLSLAVPQGVTLDAGCGAGIDLANQAQRPGVEVIGVEVSEGGCRASQRRCEAIATAFVVQADLSRLPFADHYFSFVYSYGVLHHLLSPEAGLRELVRVLRPGAWIAAYLYEDFSDRARGWRWLLACANAFRAVTTKLPPPLLYALCQLLSPVVYALFVVPHHLLRRLPGCHGAAQSLPFRHATGPFNLVGDLYDRFSAPIERRYGRAEAVALFCGAGLQDVAVVKERGWMVKGRKPPSASQAT